MLQLLTFVIVFLFLLWSWKYTQRSKNFPPGPPSWPIFGNLLQLFWRGRGGKNKHLLFRELADEYGDVIGLKMMNENVIIVSGAENIKEVTTRNEFSGRPQSFTFLYHNYGRGLGVAFNDGESWSIQRKTMVKNLRAFGLGKNSMETNISNQILHLISSIKLQGTSTAVATNDIFVIPVINILWDIVAATRYAADDKKILKFLDVSKKMIQALGTGDTLLGLFPWIRHIFPESSGFLAMYNHRTMVKKYLSDIIDEHKATLNPASPRDVIDGYLIEMDGQEEKLTRDNLLAICDDLFLAGSDSTVNSLAFIVLYMVSYPDVQKKIQEEVDTVIGRERMPILADRLKMPYTEAAILETMRHSPVTPLLVPHRATMDAQLNNYTIEKGTTVLIAAYNLSMDSLRKDPFEYRPERYIGDDGKLIQDENLIPFGTGKRRCIGEALARATMFLFVVFLLQQFDMERPANAPPPVLKGADGLTQFPLPYNTMFSLRAQ